MNWSCANGMKERGKVKDGLEENHILKSKLICELCIISAFISCSWFVCKSHDASLLTFLFYFSRPFLVLGSQTWVGWNDCNKYLVGSISAICMYVLFIFIFILCFLRIGTTMHYLYCPNNVLNLQTIFCILNLMCRQYMCSIQLLD
jgi:hypothetical protein